MIIFSGNTTIEYGMTAAGQFFENHKINKSDGIIRTTTDPERFLRWMIQSEVDEEIMRHQRERLCALLKMYWELGAPEVIRGSFNKELYLKIIKAKKENGTLDR